MGLFDRKPRKSVPSQAIQAAASARLSRVSREAQATMKRVREEEELRRTGVRSYESSPADQERAARDWGEAIRHRRIGTGQMNEATDLYPIGGELFTPITSPAGIAKLRNLNDLEQDDQIRLAKWFYQYNPIASRAINITPEYVIGDGLAFASLNAEIAKVLNRHWANPDNKWFTKQFDRCRELGLSGELILNATVNWMNGEVTLGTIISEVVYEVVSDPVNADKIHAVVVRQLPNDSTTRYRAYRVIAIDPMAGPDSPVHGMRIGMPESEDQAMEWGVNYWKGKEDEIDVPVSSAILTRGHRNIPIVWDGACFISKVNSPLGATRGWSDLFADYIWLDAHDQLLASLVQRGINAGKYLTDITLTGFGQQQIDEWVKKNSGIHYAGQEVVHNENVAYNFPSPNLRLEDSSQLANVLKNHILAGAAQPPIWFSESMTNRSSAPEMTEPSFKHLRVRQREYADLLSEIFKFCIDMAVVTGYIPSDATADKTFYLKLPDVSDKDQRIMSIAVKAIAEALAKMVYGEKDKPGILPPEEAQRLFYRYLDKLGIDTQRNEPESAEIKGDPKLAVTRLLHEADEIIKEQAELDKNSQNVVVSGLRELPVIVGSSAYYVFGDNVDALVESIA